MSYKDSIIEAAQDFHNNEMMVGCGNGWERWCNKVEALLDLPLPRGLDGDEEDDGYCLDYAHDSFLRGATPREYADDVRSKPQFRG